MREEDAADITAQCACLEVETHYNEEQQGIYNIDAGDNFDVDISAVMDEQHG